MISSYFAPHSPFDKFVGKIKCVWLKVSLMAVGIVPWPPTRSIQIRWMSCISIMATSKRFQWRIFVKFVQIAYSNASRSCVSSTVSNFFASSAFIKQTNLNELLICVDCLGVETETMGANAIGKLLEALPSFSTFKFDHVKYFKEEVYAKCKSTAILEQLNRWHFFWTIYTLTRQKKMSNFSPLNLTV